MSEAFFSIGGPLWTCPLSKIFAGTHVYSISAVIMVIEQFQNHTTPTPDPPPHAHTIMIVVL